MRYVGKDKETIFIRCSHCKKIQSLDKQTFYSERKRECPNCHEKFSFVWWCPIQFRRLRSVLPLLVMTVLSFIIIFVILFPFFQKYYLFNKSVTALNPVLSSILIPLICSVISIFPSIVKSSQGKELYEHGKRWKVVNFVGVAVEGVAVIFLINIIMQAQYSSLHIENPDTGEVQQYYGNAIGDCASGYGRLFDSQGELVYCGNFKDGLYDGYGEKFELVQSIHSTDNTESYRCIYRGDFKDGLPDGAGKEYRYDAEYTFEKPETESPYLYYDGQFSEGEYCGDGTQYNIDSKYSGVFSEGKYNGYGKEWELDSSDKKIYLFTSTFVDGRLHGSGKKYWPNGKIMFEGTYENGSATSGTFYNQDGGIRYEGKWSGKQYQGEGKLYWSDGQLRYDGQWLEDQRSGYGTSYREDGTKEYEGYWEKDQYSGYGTKFFEDGETVSYEGRFSKGIYTGQGTEYYRKNVMRYSGEWDEGNFNGYGVWYWESGRKFYEGDFENGTQTGEGTFYYESGEPSYSGEVKDGSREGEGTSYYQGTQKCIEYIGGWIENQKSGWGAEYDENHKLLREGWFENGEFVVAGSIPEENWE